MSSRPSISAFFPLYNDAPTVETIVSEVRDVLESVADDWEIVLVEDCSPDESGAIADRLASADGRIKVVHHEQNMGYGGALKSGFAAVTKDLVFYTDGDAQYDVRELPLLLSKIDGCDMVNGYKITRGDRLHRKVLGSIYSVMAKTMFGLKLRDVDCDFRLMRREVVKNLDLESDSGVVCVEMMTKIEGAGYRVREVPVHHYPRVAGRSQFFRFGRILKLVRGLIYQWAKLILLGGKWRRRPVRTTRKTYIG